MLSAGKMMNDKYIASKTHWNKTNREIKEYMELLLCKLIFSPKQCLRTK